MQVVALLLITLALSGVASWPTSRGIAPHRTIWRSYSESQDDASPTGQSEATHKGFGPPKAKVAKNPNQMSRSEQKRTYQELKKRAKKIESVHKVSGAVRESDDRQSKQRSQAW